MAPSLRSDAERNGLRISGGAQRCFAEQGLEVGVEEIARRAGVGMGTLYRRFPTKQSLVNAIFAQRLDDLQPAIDRALAGQDAWQGLVDLLLATVAQQVEDQGFSQMVVLRMGPEAVDPAIRRRVFPPLEALLAPAPAPAPVRGAPRGP